MTECTLCGIPLNLTESAGDRCIECVGLEECSSCRAFVPIHRMNGLNCVMCDSDARDIFAWH